MNKIFWAGLLAVVVFLSGFGLAEIKEHKRFPPPAGFSQGQPRKEKSGEDKDCEFKLINPLRCDNALISSLPELVPLRKKLESLIETEKQSGHIASASIYFRDLHNGPVLNINELEQFAPASLLKVPVMITYYKLAESDPGLLQREIGQDFVPKDNQNTESDQTIKPRTAYKIDDLIYKMIVYSDNRSKDLLLSYLPKLDGDFDPYLKTISDLGIVGSVNSPEDFISVKAYSSIFRTLYNASYLNNQMSEKALALLTVAVDKEGLVAGVDKNILVAHKFGNKTDPDGRIQRHDCGIVYFPNNPYILCVMTKGTDLAEQKNFIQKISATFYAEVKKQGSN